MDILRSKYLEQTNFWIKGNHVETFGSWLRTHLINNTTVGDELYLLAKSPSSTILTFQEYEINGNTFYTTAQDKKSTNQNSGVRFDATNNNGQKDTYYGYIEEIWELDYGPSFKVPLFRCKWVKLNGVGVQVDKPYGLHLEHFPLPVLLAHWEPGHMPSTFGCGFQASFYSEEQTILHGIATRCSSHGP